uniref:Uncharacterized protein n=1 Tax=Oryza punctata TaxID=4537 RepID=A0A0E0K963_ORYPU
MCQFKISRLHGCMRMDRAENRVLKPDRPPGGGGGSHKSAIEEGTRSPLPSPSPPPLAERRCGRKVREKRELINWSNPALRSTKFTERSGDTNVSIQGHGLQRGQGTNMVIRAAVSVQCCGVLLAARPLEGDVVGGRLPPPRRRWEMFVMQILKTTTPAAPDM